MAKEPKATWPFPQPGAGQGAPAAGDAQKAGVTSPATPSQGGSYSLDDATGERTLIERTEPNTQTRSRP